MPTEMGGYDAGYAAVPCFWGTLPGSLVAEFLEGVNPIGMRVLDVGAGEGKNAAAFSKRGAYVDAIECSFDAIENGKVAFFDANINWINEDATRHVFPVGYYDVVVCYGFLHCLGTPDVATALLTQTQRSLRSGGTFILASFNDGPHDLSAHPEFTPLLLSHTWYLAAFKRWEMLHATDSVLHESHPHNNIPHHHSITRLVARCP
jgi:2-polyprenyl-3-methyl-5-hydroxy-6-metoxy-1,4-benzoquinol methylase